MLTPDEIIVESSANFYAWNRTLSEHCAGEVLEFDGVLVAATGVPLFYQNSAFVTSPPREAIGALRRAVAYFEGRGLPFGVLVRDGLDAASDRACEALGMAHDATLPGMVLLPLPSAMPPPPDGLRVIEARTLAEHREHGIAMAAGFGDEQAVSDRLFPPELMDVGIRFFTGYAGDRAVVTAMLLVTGETAGIYGVATLDDHRKRGYGEALTWRAIEAGAAAGCRMASLQASAMGRPVYERMGFRQVAAYRVYRSRAGNREQTSEVP